MEKMLKTKIVFKHELEVNWLKSSYVPLNGEQVIYDAEIGANGNTLELPSGRSAPYSYPRVKIGDGVRTVNQLPFCTDLAEPAIVDVVELPTENIDEGCFYRLPTGTFIYNQYIQNGFICYCVDGLPASGEPATDTTMSELTAYYNVQDGEVYGYVEDTLSQIFGVPNGWYPISALFQAANISYGGIITDILNDPRDDSMRLLLEYIVYSYKNEKWTSHKTIGWNGEGDGAEVFNHPSNKASGVTSHAEGYNTEATGEASHAEGWGTTASGDSSHAEGSETAAYGNFSHAEGGFTTASGNFSHAEGSETTASGDYSHVQGKHNIIDTENRYAHIVGNGDNYINRSNAHTLDWNGLGWFAGGLKVGGTEQDDANAKTVATTDYVDGAIAGIEFPEGFSGDYNDLTNKPAIPTDYIPDSQKGAANGVATLGADGKVASTQLPSLAAEDVLNLVMPKCNNLFNVEALKNDPQIDNYVSISNGSLWLYNGSGGFFPQLTLAEVCPGLEVGKTYTGSYEWVPDYECSGQFVFISYKGGYVSLNSTFTVTEVMLSGTLEFGAGDGFEYDEQGNSYPYPGAGTFTNIMINEGTTALPYEPYTELSYPEGTIGALLTGIEDMIKKYVNEALLGGKW